jgi:hypothetical protein
MFWPNLVVNIFGQVKLQQTGSPQCRQQRKLVLLSKRRVMYVHK